MAVTGMCVNIKQTFFILRHTYLAPCYDASPFIRKELISYRTPEDEMLLTNHKEYNLI